MKQFLVLFLLLSQAPTQAMSKYRGPILRQLLECRRPVVAPRGRLPAMQIAHLTNHTGQPNDSREELERRSARLRLQKKWLLYSRPVLTVAGVASANYAAARFGLSPQELIGSLMVLATMNTIAFHNTEEWHSREIKDAGKKLDELDKLD